MAYHRGDVVLVPFPFADLSSVKVRPAVVLNTPEYQLETENMIVIMLTSKAHTTHYDRPIIDWKKANLVKPTWARAKTVTLDPNQVLYTVGRLTAQDMKAVTDTLKLALGL